MTNEQVNILCDAIQTYGKQSQVDKAIEEMSELTKALLKERQGDGSVDDIIEEIADVFVMICQLCLIFEASAAVDEFVDFKIDRLKRRLAERAENDGAQL